MHMDNALVSPAVGGAMLAVAVCVAAVSIKKVKDMDEQKVPLMGVMAAFVFAAQMINFAIPGGSSGHLGGGLILAILLGPYAGFLSMSAILLIQALFFADGGLLSYGCNLINMGFFACFIAYPFIYKAITRKGISKTRLTIGCVVASVFGLQLGSFSVVLETFISGKTMLPFSQFAWVMQGVHLAIGVVEGIVTAAIVSFVWKVRPDIIQHNLAKETNRLGYKSVIIGFLIATLLLAGVISLFASSNPDGLEWSIGKVAGVEELQGDTSVHDNLAEAQEKTAILPGYGFKKSGNDVKSNSDSNETMGTIVSGVVGSAVTIGAIVLIGYLIRLSKRKKIKKSSE
jgi:cobalt/nickel transport system permease protein